MTFEKLSLEKKTVVVTGAGSGIGRSIATACAAAGAEICVAGLAQPELDETISHIKALGAGDRALAVQVDVADRSSLETMYRTVLERFGSLHGIVANAGILGATGPVHQTAPEDWTRFMDVNLTGTFWTISMAAEILVRQQRGGVILATGSSAAVRVIPGMAPYVASKAAVHALMAVAALDLGPHGIRVNTIVPGQTDTPPLRAIPGFKEQAAAALPLREIVDPDEIGRYVAFALSDAVPHMTGSLLKVDSGRTIA